VIGIPCARRLRDSTRNEHEEYTKKSFGRELTRKAFYQLVIGSLQQLQNRKIIRAVQDTENRLVAVILGDFWFARKALPVALVTHPLKRLFGASILEGNLKQFWDRQVSVARQLQVVEATTEGLSRLRSHLVRIPGARDCTPV